MTAPYTCEQLGNQTALTFPGKPPENIRAALKARGFRWNAKNRLWWRRGVNGTADFLTWLDKQYEPEPLHPCRRKLDSGQQCGQPARVRSPGPYTMILCGACWREYQDAQPSQYVSK